MQVQDNFMEIIRKIHYNINSKTSTTKSLWCSKSSSYWFTKIYREYYKIYCCTGILLNHESLRFR